MSKPYPPRASADAESVRPPAAHLLAPIKKARQVVPVVRYAESLVTRQTPVTVSLLYVSPFVQRAELPVPLLKTVDDPDMARANKMLEDAAHYLRKRDIPHGKFILCGHVVQEILDAAVLLDCDAIVLPAIRKRAWTRLLFGDVVRKIVNARSGVPVVTVDPDGRAVGCSGVTADVPCGRFHAP